MSFENNANTLSRGNGASMKCLSLQRGPPGPARNAVRTHGFVNGGEALPAGPAHLSSRASTLREGRSVFHSWPRPARGLGSLPSVSPDYLSQQGPGRQGRGPESVPV